MYKIKNLDSFINEKLTDDIVSNDIQMKMASKENLRFLQSKLYSVTQINSEGFAPEKVGEKANEIFFVSNVDLKNANTALANFLSDCDIVCQGYEMDKERIHFAVYATGKYTDGKKFKVPINAKGLYYNYIGDFWGI